MIRITDKKLQAAIQIALGEHDCYTEKLEQTLIHHVKALAINGVVNWLPFERENYPEFNKLTTDRNCICLYDNGVEIDYDEPKHPNALLTHFRPKG